MDGIEILTLESLYLLHLSFCENWLGEGDPIKHDAFATFLGLYMPSLLFDLGRSPR